MSDTRRCEVGGCTNSHPANMLMCRTHWLGLPKHLRDTLWRAYRSPGVFSEEYMEARDACFAYYTKEP